MTSQRVTSKQMTFYKSILLLAGLTTISMLVACGSSGHVTTTTPPPAAISVTLTGAPTTLAVNATASITATVANDSAAKGVTWSCTPAASCGAFSSATTASGAAVTYTAPAAVPSTTVVITATSVTDPTKNASTAAITITAGAPATIVPTSGSGQTATVSTAFAAPLVATVLDGSSLPVSGASVTFTAPSTGASGTFASTGTNTETVTTDANGLATSSTFTANATAGVNYAVTAMVSGVAAPATFTLTNTASALEIITATVGSGQSTVAGTAFATRLGATVTQGGTPKSGVVVTFTAPASGASGTFANGTATTNATTNGSGVATASIFTANATAGSYTVTASATGATSATFALTNTAAVTLGAGNYVFSASGTDSANGSYSVAGFFTVDNTGTVTVGEQDFVDAVTEQPDPITGGTVAVASDGNLTVTLITADTAIGVAGTETLKGALVSSSASKALIAEFDTFATSSGELDLQPAAPPAPTGPYAFFANGLDSGGTQMSFGGVLNVDSAGAISGTGSVLDLNRNGALFPNETLTGTVTGPDASGRVIFSLTPSVASTLPAIKLLGYIVDATHIRLVEGSDNLGGVTGGVALGQTGALTVSATSYVIAATGQDPNGPIQVAGVLTFNSDLSVSGNVSFNDLIAQSPQGGSAITAGTYTLDSTTGKVTVTGITDTAADFTYNLNLYLTGDGHATVIFMDSPVGTPPAPANVLGGLAFEQAASLSASSFNGSYAVNSQQFVATGEQDGVGTVSADGVGTFAGFLDVNKTFVPASNLALSGTFAAGSTNGVLTGTITGPVLTTPQTFTYYVADPTLIVAIENDNVQLTLGYFESQ